MAAVAGLDADNGFVDKSHGVQPVLRLRVRIIGRQERLAAGRAESLTKRRGTRCACSPYKRRAGPACRRSGVMPRADMPARRLPRRAEGSVSFPGIYGKPWNYGQKKTPAAPSCPDPAVTRSQDRVRQKTAAQFAAAPMRGVRWRAGFDATVSKARGLCRRTPFQRDAGQHRNLVCRRAAKKSLLPAPAKNRIRQA